MKTRNGFVSNSSSSSYVVMTTMENHLRALSKLGGYAQAVINALEGTKCKFLGKDCISFMQLSVMDNDPFEGLDVDYDEPEDADEDDDANNPSDAFDRYRELLNEKPNEVFSDSASQG